VQKDLWPYDIDPSSFNNYYGIEQPTSWLHPIYNLGMVPGPAGQAPGKIVYFQNMSRAMAQQCGGVVYVMTFEPTKLASYGNIWGDVEWPALLNNYEVGKTVEKTLFAINADVTTKFEITFLDITTLDPDPPISGKRDLPGGAFNGSQDANTEDTFGGAGDNRGDEDAEESGIDEHEWFEKMEKVAKRLGLKQVKS
jgi:hypothetical protein